MAMATAVAILTISASANDGVYYTSGNQLIPLEETDIAVQSEVLTISLKDDGTSSVDVYYELYNRGESKTVLMGFEAEPSYNAEIELDPMGVHPYIKNFKVEMNGQSIAYDNAVAVIPSDKNAMERVDLSRWKAYPEGLTINDLYDCNGKSELSEDDLLSDSLRSITVAYVYYFKANFAPGINKVHHTYTFTNSTSVGYQYLIPYKLSPATRWANHQIDDFRLRIEARNTAKYFYVNLIDSLAKPQIISGNGKMRPVLLPYDMGKATMVALRNGIVEWHISGFRPENELSIGSADVVENESCGKNGKECQLGQYYDRGVGFCPTFYYKMRNGDKRILRNLPFASRGYVFRDKNLAQYFSQFFWYMPDKSYKPNTDDFTPQEQYYVKERFSWDEME